ncbi:MAG: HAMP domain-containing histidine kinase [Eubacterium sp.]|nr:HAMP domain-containing histidine kinase [Eubacterium sp.]
MKKYDGILAFSILTYLVIALLMAVVLRDKGVGEDVGYKVEINQIMRGLEEAGAFSEPDLSDREYVKAVSFLPIEAVYGQDTELELETDEKSELKAESKSESNAELTQEQIQVLSNFYRNRNKVNSTVYPLIIEGRLTGYVRFDYLAKAEDTHTLWLAEGILLVLWLIAFVVLCYVRQRILKPFHAVSEMPYELAKGHMQVDVEENRGKFFGRFVWGLSMLRDTLNASKAQTLRLEKEKKLLLLSISHDIKIPLSAIKLYAKAMREGIYKTADQQTHAAAQIESHAQKIEEFVGEIANTASEDIFEIEVMNTEFYLRDYMDHIRKIYEPKCKFAMTDFEIGGYENKLLKGDIDRAVEALENLLENAMKYGDGKRIGIEFYEEDYCQVIEVFSSGTPVEQKEMPHLFDSFFRGSNAQEQAGNGLGLSISKQIMLKMEGDIFAKRMEDGMSFGLVFRM